jgi:Na+-transporting methylmalonyl-CoA/oxaloacetate decarboxylase beta subunit
VEQQKKDKKNPWRFLFAGCAVYGAIKLLGALWVNLYYLGVLFWDRLTPQATVVSIGIIGGADSPTAIFVTTPPWVNYLVPALMLAGGIWGFWKLSRQKGE